MIRHRLHRNIPHSPRAAIAPLICVAIIVLAGCVNQPPLTPISAPTADSTPQPVTVPVTVEVTRVVMTERIIEATPTPQTRCSTEMIAQAREITVGAILPLSHPGAAIAAISMQVALNIAVEEINAAGGIAGKPLRVSTYDSAGSSQQAARAATELITEECAIALVGGYFSDVAQTILEVAHGYQTPFIAIDAMDDALTASEYPEIFRISASESIISTRLGEWLEEIGDYNGDDATSAVVVVENSAAGQIQEQIVSTGLEQAGFTYDVHSVDLPTQDFSSLIARIVVKQTQPDLLIIRINGDAALDLQQQLLANGIGPHKNTQIVTSRSALNGEEFWQHMGNAGVYTVASRNGAWPSTTDDMGKAFAQRFEAYLDRWPEGYAFSAYDAVWLVADAIQRAGSTDTGAIIRALEQTDMQLTNGRYYFPYGSNSPPAQSGADRSLWHQWTDPPVLLLQYTEVNQPPAEMAVLWPPTYSTVETPLLRPQGDR
jgi:branched-chain amino acid transport system substrate-binding protein